MPPEAFLTSSAVSYAAPCWAGLSWRLRWRVCRGMRRGDAELREDAFERSQPRRQREAGAFISAVNNSTKVACSSSSGSGFIVLFAAGGILSWRQRGGGTGRGGPKFGPKQPMTARYAAGWNRTGAAYSPHRYLLFGTDQDLAGWRLAHFETAPIDRSGTSPAERRRGLSTTPLRTSSERNPELAAEFQARPARGSLAILILYHRVNLTSGHRQWPTRF
jgi:hypothetical protein